MKKYFVTYTEFITDKITNKKTRFFVCDDLELEWERFC